MTLQCLFLHATKSYPPLFILAHDNLHMNYVHHSYLHCYYFHYFYLHVLRSFFKNHYQYLYDYQNKQID